MGMRNQPIDLLRPASQQADPRLNVRQGSSAQISKEFIGTIDRGVRSIQAENAKKEQQKKDFTKVIFKNDIETMRAESEERLANAKGANALSEAKDIKAEYLNKVKERMNLLPDQYKNSMEFQTEVAKSTGLYDRFSLGHTYGQVRKLEEEAFNTSVANDVNKVIGNATDVDYVTNSGVNDIIESITKRAEKKYGTDRSAKVTEDTTVGDIIDTEVQAGVSAALTEAIKYQVAVERFDKVQETVERNFERLTPTDREKIAGIVDKGRKDASSNLALRLSEEAYTLTGGDPVRAQQYILARTKDGDIVRKANSFIATKEKLRKDAEKKRDKSLKHSALEQLNATGRIDPSVIRSMTADAQEDLFDYVNKHGGQPPTISKPGVLFDATKQMSNLSDKEKVNIDIDKEYKYLLSFEDRKNLRKMQDQARKRIDGKLAKAQEFNQGMNNDITNLVASSMEIYVADDPIRYAGVKSWVTGRYLDMIEQNPNMSREEQKATLTRLAFEARDRGDFDKFVSSEDVQLERNTAIPDSGMIRALQQKRIKEGKEPLTPAQIQGFLRSRQR